MNGDEGLVPLFTTQPIIFGSDSDLIFFLV